MRNKTLYSIGLFFLSLQSTVIHCGHPDLARALLKQATDQMELRDKQKFLEEVGLSNTRQTQEFMLHGKKCWVSIVNYPRQREDDPTKLIELSDLEYLVQTEKMRVLVQITEPESGLTMNLGKSVVLCYKGLLVLKSMLNADYPKYLSPEEWYRAKQYRSCVNIIDGKICFTVQSDFPGFSVKIYLPHQTPLERVIDHIQALKDISGVLSCGEGSVIPFELNNTAYILDFLSAVEVFDFPNALPAADSLRDIAMQLATEGYPTVKMPIRCERILAPLLIFAIFYLGISSNWLLTLDSFI